MKNYLKLFSILLVLVMMTGCVKYDFDMKITNDKKMNVSAILASSVGFDNSVKSKFEKAGFKVENYKDDTYTGIKITKTYKNIDKISSKDEVIVDLNSFSSGEEPKEFFKKDGNKYSAKFKFTMDSMNNGENDPNAEPTTGTTNEDDYFDSTDKEINFDGMEDSMEIKLSVEVPKVISSNATTSDGNKLTWDLTKHTGDITFEFEVDGKGSIISSDNIVMYAGIAGGVILVAVAAIVILKKGKKTPVQNTVNNTQVNNSTPVDEKNENN